MDSEARIGDLVEYAIGGGWGSDEPTPDGVEVAVIRGADFPSFKQNPDGVPRRFEKASKVSQRTLRHGDIVLEISGGTRDRSTGRTIYIEQELLNRLGTPAIPASFCRLLRVDEERADPLYVYYCLQEMHSSGRARLYQNQSTGLSNFQFKHFLEAECVRLPPFAEQRAIAEVLASLDHAIENRFAQHRGRIELLINLVTAPRHGSLVGGFELTIGGDWGAGEPDVSHTEAVMCLRGKDLEGLLAGAADDIPVRYLKPSSVKKRRLQPGDVLTAGSGTLGPTLLITESLLSGFSLPLVYSNFVKRIRTSSAEAVPVGLFAALHRMWRAGSIDQFRTGTAMPNLDAKALVKNVETPTSFEGAPTPIIDDLLSFDDIAAVRTLQSIRDALLPKLVSGELRIEDPQRLLDQVS